MTEQPLIERSAMRMRYGNKDKPECRPRSTGA
jgi:hypothetical protein